MISVRLGIAATARQQAVLAVLAGNGCLRRRTPSMPGCDRLRDAVTNSEADDERKTSPTPTIDEGGELIRRTAKAPLQVRAYEHVSPGGHRPA